MSSPEYHSVEEWEDPPPPSPSVHSDPNMDDDMDEYEDSQILEIDYITLPTLQSLGMRRRDYQSFPEEMKVVRCVREVTREGGLWYSTVFADGHTDMIPFERLLTLEGGSEALEGFGSDAGEASIKSRASLNSRKRATATASNDGDREQEMGDNEDGTPSLGSASISNRGLRRRMGEEEDDDPASISTRELRRLRIANLAENRKAQLQEGTPSQSPSLSDDELQSPDKRRSQRRTRSQPLKKASMLPYRGQSQSRSTRYDSDDDLVVSDLIQYPRKRSRLQSHHSTRTSNRKRKQASADSDFSNTEPDTRRSGRTSTKRNLYTEPGIDDDFMDIDSLPAKPTKPRVVHAKEIFPTLDEDGPFVQFHSDTCDTCGEVGPSRSRGALVYCQGCSYVYHTDCIGHRSGREHLVTKVDDDDFVLQCRRCIGRPHRKDPTAPHTDRCVACHTAGKSCPPFRDLKKPKSGDASIAATPDVDIPRELLYSAENLLFRCSTCRRAWHYDHLPPLTTDSRKSNLSKAELRLAEYSLEAKCTDCTSHPDKIHVIRAWRPADSAIRETHPPETIDITDFAEDEREYLVKFAETSYFRVEWLPAPWVWGAHNLMRTNFIKKGPMLAYTTEQAVLESYLRVEIVFDVHYSSIVPTGEDMDVDLKRIGEVTEALVKYQGLGYDDVVWEVPPGEDGDAERWADWKRAYENHVHGAYVRLPRNSTKKQAVARGKSFEGKLEKKTQPSYIQGGELMAYQMEGMNWLYYKWYQNQTAILADEMGLGKTIQVISFLSVMVNDLNLWPFLIVVPHSTVPNWKREISHWCPSMRVVAYFGADKARQLQRKYEMFHRGGSGRDLKCHIVVTSYSTPLSDSQYLKNIPWEALIVDEGQRLKNDQSLLYKALEGYKIKHKVLMTGTPLQNNPRELFNLLHFLDPKIDAQELEEEFGELTRENVPRLHEMIRPFFLRRTKKEVLTFLPPMAEVIVPVTMSSLQRKLYKSILAKDPALIKSIFRNPGDKSKSGNLKNVLMQLRKVLGHPFFYSDDIEDRSFDAETLHQNLIEAGSKFELLNIMLPKLKERGHRVLMFSQFLGMLDVMEDFLAGLGLKYQRLDGTTNTQEKQRRIDAYNAPGSEDFAFLLSTRAGGVGINLATADTVIILDPDFNPHQDIQALSRAHRIGQKNKVLVFHLVTRDTAEEKIMQIGKKKLSLDHLIIEKMGAEGDEEELVDVESVLKFGARALFEGEGEGAEEKRIRYDSDGVDRLLDRSTIEETKTTEVAGAENAFSFARVWANEKGSLEEGGLGDDVSDVDMDTGFWDKLLAEREEQARIAAAKVAEELGRGKRKKKVDYSLPQDEYNEASPGKGKLGGVVEDAASEDGDFRAEEEESESDGGADLEEGMDMMDLDLQRKVEERRYQDMLVPTSGRKTSQYQGQHFDPAAFNHQRRPPVIPYEYTKGFARAFPDDAPIPLPPTQVQFAPAPMAPMHMQHSPRSKKPKKPADRSYRPVTVVPVVDVPGSTTKCRACKKLHPSGQCKLKKMGVEHCPLCGIAHFGKGPTCPSLGDEASITAMLQALSSSKEDPQMVKDAKNYLRGRKGALRQKAAMDARNAANAATAMAAANRMARNA